MKISLLKKYTPILLLAFFGKMAFASTPNWALDYHSFQHSMIVIGVIETECTESANQNNIVGAFVNGECRGVQVADVQLGGRQLTYLYIYSNQVSGEIIHFKVYDAKNDLEIDLPTTIAFVYDGVIGGNSKPFVFKTNTAPYGIGLSDSTISDTSKIGTEIGLFSSLDSNLTDTFEYQFVDGLNSEDNGSFSINKNQLIVNTSLDYSIQNKYKIRIRTRDNTFCYYEKSFEIKVTDEELVGVNEAANTSFFLYPNPTTGKINFNKEAEEIKIYTSEGKKIVDKKAKEFLALDLPSGIYRYILSDLNSKIIEKSILIIE
jgi:hypothetical protein